MKGDVVDKAAFLKANGWETLWADDFWVESGKEYQNIDTAGLSTDEAYEVEMKRERQREFDKEHGIVRKVPLR